MEALDGIVPPPTTKLVEMAGQHLAIDGVFCARWC